MHYVLQDTYYNDFIVLAVWIHMSYLFVKDAKWAQVHMDLLFFHSLQFALSVGNSRVLVLSTEDASLIKDLCIRRTICIGWSKTNLPFIWKLLGSMSQEQIVSGIFSGIIGKLHPVQTKTNELIRSRKLKPYLRKVYFASGFKPGS